jgi:hypothetical protein
VDLPPVIRVTCFLDAIEVEVVVGVLSEIVDATRLKYDCFVSVPRKQ